jgi:hypothetical protein
LITKCSAGRPSGQPSGASWATILGHPSVQLTHQSLWCPAAVSHGAIRQLDPACGEPLPQIAGELIHSPEARWAAVTPSHC